MDGKYVLVPVREASEGGEIWKTEAFAPIYGRGKTIPSAGEQNKSSRGGGQRLAEPSKNK